MLIALRAYRSEQRHSTPFRSGCVLGSAIRLIIMDHRKLAIMGVSARILCRGQETGG
jgi:hypothetical protein